MVKSGVLPVLWRVIHQFTNEASIKSLCVRIVANISKFTPLHVHIFQSGECSPVESSHLFVNNFRTSRLGWKVGRVHAIGELVLESGRW